MYQAICGNVIVRPHPNSDNGLKLVTISGHQVVTGADIQEGDTMVFFPEGGVICDEYLSHHNEYRVKWLKNSNQQGKDEQEALEQPGGFFEHNGRVRAIKLRGERSEGYVVRLEQLEFLGDVSSLTAGTTFDTIGGTKLCWKYVSPATQKAIAQAKKQGKRKPKDPPMFKQHFDTAKFRYNEQNIPDGAIVHLSEKLHGTSGRTGRVLVDQRDSYGIFKRLLIWFATLLGLDVNTEQWEVVTGTRRVVLENDGEEGENNFHKGTNFRQVIHKQLAPLLRKGETFYYEIVGYDERGNAFFTHTIPDDPIGKAIWKKYKSSLQGKTMVYSYGCEPGSFGVWVYRITQTNEDGETVDLSGADTLARCVELGLRHVPVIGSYKVFVKDDKPWINTGNQVGPLRNILGDMAEGLSSLDSTHISEGVVIRVESPSYSKSLKYKSFSFAHCEGIRKNDDNYIDIEEIS